MLRRSRRSWRWRRSPRALAATPPTSASGCGASRASLALRPIARRARSRMRSSRWHALGNSYLLLEDAELTPEQVRELVGDADGILEVRVTGDDTADVTIWNPDGSQAELSGNGTRIAARWLAERNGVSWVRLAVGPRVVEARMLADGRVATDLGEVKVYERERGAGLGGKPVSVGKP